MELPFNIDQVISLGKAQCCLAKFCYSDPLSKGRGYPFRTVASCGTQERQEQSIVPFIERCLWEGEREH
ncbi:hypothetical protein TIFTF001_015704 [Ficus carica]|uniref:Uncharacterized protein n=1 Tax=Ficus carica TaxID=3494 RepID=A0AA88ASL7_FICCA|nr:hypothetical protein TIFTF001_015704 [Ficus carica]